jgi:hypothetical protein
VINLLPILADEPTRNIALPVQLPQQMDLINWCQNIMPGTAVLLIVLGLIYLLYGYRIIKVLVMFNAIVAGAGIGFALGRHGEAALACAIIGAFATAAITWPAMRYAVALMGGIIGALLAGGIWHAIGLDPRFAWAGALVGLVGLGLLCFILFRGSVMMYTSLQGAVMFVLGVLGLIYKYQELAPRLNDHFRVEPFLFPAVVFIPAMIGLIYQQHQTASGGGGGHGGKK